MPNSIFCPSSHLILDAPTCPQCGWQRPPAAASGERLWGPVELCAGLGGPGRSVFARPAALQGIAAFPCNNGEIIGVSLADGRRRWTQPLDAGQMVRDIIPASIAPDSSDWRFLVGISDERPIDQNPGPGRLAAIDPLKGSAVTLWEAGSHQITPPVLAGQAILLRTSAGEIIALRSQPPHTVIWQQKLDAWWPLAPVIAGEIVLIPDGRAMHNEARLLALALEDGRLLWEQPTDGMLAQPPVIAQGMLVYQDGRKCLTARHVHSGELAWQNTYPRHYARPAADASHIYLAVRGQAPEGAAGHYMLVSLAAKDGRSVWQAALPAGARPRSGLLLFEGQLLLSSDNGRMISCSAGDGAVLWDHELGSPYDPPRTELIVAGGVLLAGSSSGLAMAIQIAKASTEPCSPQEYLQRGDYQGAADSLALCGDFLQAAEIYARQLKQIPKALLLLEKGGRLCEAGQLAKENGLYSQAEEFFRKANDLPEAAEMMEKNGDLLGAARLFEQAGELKRAAGLFKQGGETLEAMRLYMQINDVDSLAELAGQTDPDLKHIEYLRQHGQEVHAAGLALKHGYYHLAVDIYNQLGDIPNQILALNQLVQSEPTAAWAWERLTSLARQRGDFQLEAKAWLHLDQAQQAAEALYNAARQMVQRDPRNEQEIAGLFERAGKLFSDEGLEERYQECHSQVVQYRHLPQIEISGQSEHGFIEGQFNTLDLVIHNIGNGPAKNISVRPVGDRFEVGVSATDLRGERLAPGHHIKKPLFIRPKQDQIGEAVPLVLEWVWKDRFDNDYRDQRSTAVAVRPKGESPSSGTPVVIHAQTYVQGTLTQITGDQVNEGGRKGSTVEIRHGEDAKVHAARQPGSAAGKPTCPNCSLPVEKSQKFCQVCGWKLK